MHVGLRSPKFPYREVDYLLNTTKEESTLITF